MYEENKEEKAGADYVPVPKGYRILIAMPKVSDVTEGGIFKPGQLVDREEVASIVGQVVDMGPDCYADLAKFPSGAWCEVGDWVLFRSYAGTRFKIGEREFRMINDDVVEGVVANPKHIKRV